MKTLKILFMLNILLGFAVSAKSQSIVTKVYDFPWETWIYCGGIENHISGSVTLHTIFHYNKNGNLVSTKCHYIGSSLTSDTGESFSTKYLTNQEEYNPSGGTLTWRFIYNLVGDRGTHVVIYRVYEIELTSDPDNPIWHPISDKTFCL